MEFASHENANKSSFSCCSGGGGGGGGGQEFSFLLDFSILWIEKETSTDGAERKLKAG